MSVQTKNPKIILIIDRLSGLLGEATTPDGKPTSDPLPSRADAQQAVCRMVREILQASPATVDAGTLATVESLSTYLFATVSQLKTSNATKQSIAAIRLASQEMRLAYTAAQHPPTDAAPDAKPAKPGAKA